MNHQMPHDMDAHIFGMWVAGGIILLIFTALIFFFTRRVASDRLAIADLAARLKEHTPTLQASPEQDRIQAKVGEAQDTIFILPDISHYTHFMSKNRFAFAHAQEVVFALINAIIEAATRTIEISKLEGDAALFFVDTGRYSKEALGKSVTDILAAFYGERRRLISSNICPCEACQQIGDLELKIFVHRGRASRFKFRGTVDLFGTDVIVLHRLMKNDVDGDRYVMVTDAAADTISFAHSGPTFDVEEHLPQIGDVQATIFEIGDEMVETLSQQDASPEPTALEDTYRKLRENVRSLKSVFRPAN